MNAPRPLSVGAAVGGAVQDPLALLDGVPLTSDEAGYVEAARAANTMRGYRSDWREFTTWCTQHDTAPMPAPRPRSPDTWRTWPGPGRRSAP